MLHVSECYMSQEVAVLPNQIKTPGRSTNILINILLQTCLAALKSCSTLLLLPACKGWHEQHSNLWVTVSLLTLFLCLSCDLCPCSQDNGPGQVSWPVLQSLGEAAAACVIHPRGGYARGYLATFHRTWEPVLGSCRPLVG